jgi:hypothetical protein
MNRNVTSRVYFKKIQYDELKFLLVKVKANPRRNILYHKASRVKLSLKLQPVDNTLCLVVNKTKK